MRRTGALRKQLLALGQITPSPSSPAAAAGTSVAAAAGAAARAFSVQVNYLPHNRSLIPRHVRLAREDREAMLDEFPVMELREAFRRCKVGALPVQSGIVSRRRESVYAAEIRYARQHATGDVKLLLQATAAIPSEDEGAVRRELTKRWQDRGTPLTAEIVVGVLRGASSARLCMHFFNWAAAQPGFQHSTATYNGLVQMLVKHDFFQQALRLYGIMQGKAFRKAGCGADTVTLGILVRRLLSSAKGFEQAIELLNEAKAYGIPVTDQLIHEVICFLCKLKNMLPLSLRYFHRMKNPSDKTYHVLVRTMCKEHFVDEAYDLIVSMAVEAGGCPTDDVTYHMLITEFCKRGELSKAHVLLHDCIDRGRVPSVLTYNSVLELLSRKGGRDGADKAFNLLQSMVSKNVAPNVVTYTTVIQGLAKGGRLDDAMTLLEEMLGRECVPDLATGKALVAALVSKERVAEALELVLRMSNRLKQPLDFESSSSVVYGFLRAGRIQDALDAVTKLEGKTFSPDLPMYNVFIGVLCHKGRFPLALRFYRELLRKGLTPDASTFAPMIISYCDHDKVPEAYGVFKEMLQKNCTPNLSIYKAIIGAFCKKGNMDEACQLLEQMFNKDCYPDAALYKVVIKGLRKTGNAQACDILENAVKQSGDAPDEAMFKAIYKLRSCIRPPRRHKASSAADGEQVAEVVEVIPAKLRFGDSESESDSESE